MLLETKTDVEFPTVLAFIPLVIGVINIVSAFSLTTAREKTLVIIFSVLYIFLSGTLIYNGAKLWQR